METELGQHDMGNGEPKCDVSFAVACYNALPFLNEAIASALAQTNVSVEVLIVDDHSTDESKACALEWQARDRRVRVFQTSANGGPACARNVALQNMCGAWLAVLDSDDFIDPARSQKLIETAEFHGADIVADNLMVFGDGFEDHRFLDESFAHFSHQIDLDTYFKSTIMFANAPNLGFLKPMVRRSSLEATGIRYNEDLRIAEDDEFIVRLLLAGLKYQLAPEALYNYRKHNSSISHRLSADHARRMLASELNISEQVRASGLGSRAYQARLRSLISAEAFTRSIEGVKAGSLSQALSPLAHTPSAVLHYKMPLMARLNRLLRG